MHELNLVFHIQEIGIVVLQTIFFISAFQSFIICQSLIGSIAALSFFLWLASSFQNLPVVLAAIIGLVTAILTVSFFKLPKNRSGFYVLYYFIIQPFILYKLVPLFVVQTNYPVGYVLAFLLWFQINLLVYHYHTPLPRFVPYAIFGIVISLFFFGFFFYRTEWISIIISLVVHGIILMMIHRYHWQNTRM
jgi:hypothetical protein